MSQSVKEFLEALAGCIIIVGLVAAYCAATPPQLSAEADIAAEQLEAVEGR